MTGPLWRDLTHQQVWDQVQAGPGPYVSDSAATAWSNAQAALRQIDGDLDAAITKAAGWTGSAADATRSGLTPLGGWAVDATGSAGRAAASLTEHQVQVAWVRANLPEPGPAPGIDPPIPLSDAGVDPAVLRDWTVTVGRNTALADQAFHVMDTYATNTALIQQQVPTWTPPPAVTMSVADGLSPSGPAMASAKRAVGAFPATVAPAAAASIGAAVAAGGVVVGQNGAQHPAGVAAAQEGNGPGHLSPAAVSMITPTPSGPAGPSLGSRASASRDNSALPVPGTVVGRPLPGGSGVLRGVPDGAAPSARGGAGGLDGSGARQGTGGPSSGRDADGVLRGLPGRGETSTGVLRGVPGGGGRTDLGTGALGGQQGESAVPGRGGVGPADPQSTFRGAAATGRPGAEGSPGYLPMGGAGFGNQGNTHRTPDYLMRSYAFFADDRRLAGPLIIPEEPSPLRT